ncbi:MAG: GDSL-type esterase/lipase family protein [Schleiferiaceae bacterium]|nr:GDSL-type esterase/lipase family protein [Schleiferiaceae bacterium]
MNNPSKKPRLNPPLIFLLILFKQQITSILSRQKYKNSPLLLGGLLGLMLSCQSSEGDPTPVHGAPPAELHYLALGNSYTIGTAIPNHQRYPSLLADSLMQAHRYKTTYLRIIARNGWTTTDLLRGLDTSRVDSNYQLVTLLIGVNNQYQGLPLPLYHLEMRLLIQRAIAHARGQPSRVLVISIPDWSATPSGRGQHDSVAAAIDRYNAVNRHLSDSLGTGYAAITALSRTALGHPALVAADSLHFSGPMHQRWLPLLFRRSDSLLRRHW